jgi:copper resistance protein C
MNRFIRNTAIALWLSCAIGHPVQAHAFLESATPAVGGTVRQSPPYLVIGFTESVEPDFSTIIVQDAVGAHVETGRPATQGDDRHLVVGLKPLLPGAYKVTWHATSTDTHKTQGSFTFTVQP